MTPNRIDLDYLAWIRAHECAAPSELAGGRPCGGLMESHHIFGRGMGGGKRDDRFTVPLCCYHHREIHDTGTLHPEGWDKSALVERAYRLLVEYLDE